MVREFDGSFGFERIQVDSPRGSEVPIEVRAASPCHSDLHLASNLGIPAPMLLGHEISGAGHRCQAAGHTLRPASAPARVEQDGR